MIKNKIIRRVALIISLIMLLTSTINATFGLIVTKTDSLINTFIPFDNIISNLLISKNVEHPFGDEYVIPDDIEFDFKVDFGSYYANATIKTTNGDVTADENGTVFITVKPGKLFAVDGIDSGTKVTVTEIQKSDSGFTVKDGAATMEGIVAKDGSLNFNYTNIYTPTSISPINVTVKGSKILEGRDWRAGDSFSFLLEQKTSENTWNTLDTKTVSYSNKNKNFNNFDFTEVVQQLIFDEIGTYYFRVTEVIGDLEDVDYDKSVNTFSIKVTDVDMDGKLEIDSVTAEQNAKVIKTDGKFNVDITFNNTFIPAIPIPEDITVEINVEKSVKNIGNTNISPAGFEFVLENMINGEKTSVKSDETGNAAFLLMFTADDIGKTYTYKLYESDGGMLGVKYDNKVYELTIDINLDENNQLISTVLMDGEEVDEVLAMFENTYSSELPIPDDISVEIVANKTVLNKGEAKIRPEGFEFVLENIANGNKLIRTSNSDGKASFALPFTASDIGKTYNYRLSETDKGAIGMIYDVKVYYISVSVLVNQDNKLVANVVMNGHNIEKPVAEFVNTYNADLPNTPQTGDNRNIIVWFVLMLLSGCAFVSLIIIDRKIKKENY